MKAVKEEFGDERKTPIEDKLDLSTEDLITPEDMVVTISNMGYAKTQPLEVYQSQRRGGMGKTAASVKDEDFVEQLIVANTHRTLLCFSNLGKVYWLKVYEIPQASRIAKGRPLVNLIELDEQERVTSLLDVQSFEDEAFVFMATQNGIIKKTPLSEFKRPRNAIYLMHMMWKVCDIMNHNLKSWVLRLSSRQHQRHADKRLRTH